MFLDLQLNLVVEIKKMMKRGKIGVGLGTTSKAWGLNFGKRNAWSRRLENCVPSTVINAQVNICIHQFSSIYQVHFNLTINPPIIHALYLTFQI